MRIPGYTISGKIYESERTLIFRGLRLSDEKPVVIKCINPLNEKRIEWARFEKEYEISCKFNDRGIAACLGLEKPADSPVMVFEDIGGLSLDKTDAFEKNDASAILAVALDIAAAIGRIHGRGIIHNAINPSNIVLNRRTGRINIIDFGASSELAGQDAVIRHMEIPEGSLPYISPEQTRRINHAVDYRTDIYSFGVTLYQMLTGRLPFSGNDSLEIVHAHIAGTPAPPHEIRPDLPAALSKIIEKLMAKAPENRYQSIHGLVSDISGCIEAMRGKRNIDAFIPGRRDFSEKLILPQRLYGRQKETGIIVNTYKRVLEGATEMLLVHGSSGIGKSFLVSELRNRLSWNKCLFISGKCDQYKCDLPYTVIIDAFSELTGRILSESQESIDRWKQKILSAIGSSSQAIIDCIPDLEIILGKQPSEKKQPATAAKNQFQSVFGRFTQVFASREHPLVLFLDDLQWADSASLALLTRILTEPGMPHLLIIGTFRDDCIEDMDRLSEIRSEIEKGKIRITRVPLAPLYPSTVNRLVADALGTDPKETIALSKKISAKTGGNPFFLKEFLKTLHREGTIFFHRKTCRWQWDLASIQKMSITDNVVDLLIRKIHYLPSDVATLLMLAACIGNRFTFQTLSLISRTNFNETVNLLSQAVDAELIVPADDNYAHLLTHPNAENRRSGSRLPHVAFRFTHDRVQEAVYQMFSLQEKQEAHLRTGLLMLARTPRDELGENLFHIVNHFNIAESKIHDPDEKLLLARLNLEAGQKAMRAAAHGTALTYFAGALNVLPEKRWDYHYELTRSIYMEYAQCEYLNGRISLSESRFRFLLGKVRTTAERIEIYHLIIRILQNQGEYEQVVKTCINALALLNAKIPLNPGKKGILLKTIKIRLMLQGKKPKALARLGRMKDRRILSIMDTLGETIGAAMIYNSDCAMYIGLKMMELTLKYGNSDHSPFVYSAFGAILAGNEENYQSGYAYGRLSLSMIEHSDDKNLICKTNFLFARNVNHWVRHAGTSIDLYTTTYREGLESGNVIFSAWAAVYLLIVPIITGSELSRITGDIEKYTRFIKRVGYADMLYFCKLSQKYVSALEGDAHGRCDFSSEEFHETSLIREMKRKCRHSSVFAFYYTIKIQLCFLSGQFEKALDAAASMEEIASEIKGLIFFPEHYFYAALSMARIYPAAPKRQKKRVLRRMKKIKNRFAVWSKNAAVNFHHKHMLICAEMLRITGKKDAAAGFYAKSIQSAATHGYTQNEAVAYECSARFYMETNNMEMANTCLANAHFAYLKWGAATKAAQLEADFPFLSPFAGTKHMASPWETNTTGTHFHNLFDWRSILKTFRSISREIDLAALIRTMMKNIIENAGAQRGVLLLNRENRMFIEAESRIEWKHVELTRSIPLSEYDAIPSSIINYTARKFRRVILDDAQAGHMFSDDPYFEGCAKKSVLCSPVLHQGKIKGIIYLENDAVPSIFTKERAFAVDMLSAQAAVSLENAILYKRLKESENKYRSIFENAVEGIFQVTREGTFISLNQSLSAILGYDDPEQLIDSNTNIVDLFFYDLKRRNLFMRQLVKTGRIRGFEGSGKRKDGTPFWVSVSARAVFDTRGKIAYYEGSVVDIAERKQKEEAERQRKAAEAEARAKSTFLASMSHEIRTPLNAIIGLSELSMINGIEGKHRGFVTKINECASSLLTIIDDILHFSRIEAGRVALENIDFTISEITEKIKTLFMHQTAGKNITLTFAVSDTFPPFLTGDPFRLRQVLTNLTANAFKFTKEGAITIQAECIERDNGKARLRFSVSDTGTGIPENNISHLFTPFFQADNSISRRYGGTGLGLAISKGIVDLMNGRIWAKNNSGGGATFYFEIDAGYRKQTAGIMNIHKAPEDAYRNIGKPRQAPTGMRLLLVDDNAINREVMPGILESAGYMVDTASSGTEAIKKAALKSYDAVLMDVQMPGMDGFQAAATIRKNPDNKDLVIIAITAHAMDGYRDQCIHAGMTDYIPKPVDMDHLNKTLAGSIRNYGGHVRKG